jgi:NAD(P)H-hydrate epimerase
VIDADALVMLAGQLDALASLAATRTMVLTPHPGEFGALFPDLAEPLPHDPWTAAAAAHARVGATVLLKGVPTVIAAAIAAPLTVAAGNPGLATGGSGDVLSGLIGGLLGHDRPGPVAAALGAQALGDAADIAAAEHGVRVMRPMDVIAALPRVWGAWHECTRIRVPELLELPRPVAG